MLKIQEVSEYCTDMSEVAEDFTQVLLERRNKDNEVVGLKEEVFKWAMECELCQMNKNTKCLICFMRMFE